MVLARYDRDALRAQFQNATPFPSMCIDGFLEPEFAAAAARAFPPYTEATQLGHEFRAVNERSKVQICDEARFPEELQKLSATLSSPEFIADLEYITGIRNLRWDPSLAGGGMHLTASSGHLDVHVDFNRQTEGGLYRRLNILVYLNPDWDEAWGGAVELWDADVRNCVHRYSPFLNRCVVFETSNISFHGVTPVKCPKGRARQSFAAYYYTEEAPPSYEGVDHSTIFKARPDEKLKSYLMVAEGFLRSATERGRSVRRRIRKLVKS